MTNVILYWNQISSLADLGYSSLTGYKVYWDNGTAAAMNVVGTPITHTGTTISLPIPGANYSF